MPRWFSIALLSLFSCLALAPTIASAHFDVDTENRVRAIELRSGERIGDRGQLSAETYRGNYDAEWEHASACSLAARGTRNHSKKFSSKKKAKDAARHAKKRPHKKKAKRRGKKDKQMTRQQRNRTRGEGSKKDKDDRGDHFHDANHGEKGKKNVHYRF